MTKKSDKTTKTKGPLYLYGLDEAGKPRGARFAESRDDIVKAANALGCLSVLNPPPAFAELGVKLPLGRIYSSGKAFVPNIRTALFDKLVEAGKALGLEAPQRPLASATNAPVAVEKPTHGLPSDWKSIEVGQLVLVQETLADGWWEAETLERDGDIVTVRYRDYPKYPVMKRHVSAVALLNPGTV